MNTIINNNPKETRKYVSNFCFWTVYEDIPNMVETEPFSKNGQPLIFFSNIFNKDGKSIFIQDLNNIPGICVSNVVLSINTERQECTAVITGNFNTDKADNIIMNYLTGQYSDGFGEVLEQEKIPFNYDSLAKTMDEPPLECYIKLYPLESEFTIRRI